MTTYGLLRQYGCIEFFSLKDGATAKLVMNNAQYSFSHPIFSVFKFDTLRSYATFVCMNFKIRVILHPTGCHKMHLSWCDKKKKKEEKTQNTGIKTSPNHVVLRRWIIHKIIYQYIPHTYNYTNSFIISLFVKSFISQSKLYTALFRYIDMARANKKRGKKKTISKKERRRRIRLLDDDEPLSKLSRPSKNSTKKQQNDLKSKKKKKANKRKVSNADVDFSMTSPVIPVWI